MPREDSVFSLRMLSWFKLWRYQKSDDSRYADGIDIELVNLGPIALFSNNNLTTPSGKHLEGIGHAHIVFFV